MKYLTTAVSVIALFGNAAPASANETITYTYDVHGRLVQSSRSGTVNASVTTGYSHDKADNRTSKVVSGA